MPEWFGINKECHKVMKKTASFVIVLAASFGLMSTTSGAADVNFGQCMANVQPGVQKINAPGQSGNGPLTIVNGESIWPDNAFDGAVGCPHQ
jgi:hypothetical protein